MRTEDGNSKRKRDGMMTDPEPTRPTGDGAATEPVAIDETERLIASSKVEGTPVYHRDGERLGEVHNFMVDKFTGQVAYAVMGFGGFLGIGERYHPLPWKALDYDAAMGGFVVDIDKAQLETAPSYGLNEDPWADPAFGRGVYGFYGLPWYF